MNEPPPLTSTRRIKRFAPLQLGKILAAMYGLMGLLVTPFFLIASLIPSQLSGSQHTGMMALGAGFALLFPIFYAAMGFVLGALSAWVYNLVVRWTGGIEVEVE